jgi:hypothetical protein
MVDENTDPSARRAKPVERDLHGPTDGGTKDITIGSNAVEIAETGAAPFARAPKSLSGFAESLSS